MEGEDELRNREDLFVSETRADVADKDFSAPNLFVLLLKSVTFLRCLDAILKIERVDVPVTGVQARLNKLLRRDSPVPAFRSIVVEPLNAALVLALPWRSG
jgi:hypothetical protein